MVMEHGAHMPTQCAGCDLFVESPGIIICPDCLTGRFCNEDCQLKGLEKHKTWCKKWACEKLTTIVEPLAESYTREEWGQAVKDSLCCHHVLPDCCTEKQLDDLSVLWPIVSPIFGSGQTVVYEILILATTYARIVDRPAARVERLLRDSCELVRSIPPISEEKGELLWDSGHVYSLCLNVGNLMVKSGKPRDAVDWMQHIKPNLDVAMLLERPRSDGSGFMEGQSLVSAYKFYSSWVRACIPQDITRAEYRAHPDLQRGIELLKQAIKLGKGLTNPEELEVVAACGLDLGMEYLRLEDVEVALQYFQKCLKLPWNDNSGQVAVRAVECLLMAGRDTQAGKWIDQFLRLEQHCPGRLRQADQSSLHCLRALLYRRRGQHEEALGPIAEARRLAPHDHCEDRQRSAIVEASLDLLDCVDAFKGRAVLVDDNLKHGVPYVERPLDCVLAMQAVVDTGEEAQALVGLEVFNAHMLQGFGSWFWRWRVKGVTLWGDKMLNMWEELVMRLMPEGESRTSVLASIEGMKGMETSMKQKLLEDRRAQAIAEVREQVTGKPPADTESILEVTAEPTGDRKPSKAARKKRKKRQKKAAQAHDDSSQQGAEAGLEQSMAGLDMTQEHGASEEEGQAGAEDETPSVAREREECAICLNELAGEGGEDEEGLACGHVLHASCLRCWASKCASLCIDATCPVCRSLMGEESSN